MNKTGCIVLVLVFTGIFIALGLFSKQMHELLYIIFSLMAFAGMFIPFCYMAVKDL